MKEEKYTLELNAAQAAYLHGLLSIPVDQNGSILAWSIRDELNYSPPRFAVGSHVVRLHPGPEGAGKLFKVTGHRFVSPSNWTAMLESVDNPSNTFGVGEVYLAERATNIHG